MTAFARRPPARPRQASGLPFLGHRWPQGVGVIATRRYCRFRPPWRMSAYCTAGRAGHRRVAADGPQLRPAVRTTPGRRRPAHGAARPGAAGPVTRLPSGSGLVGEQVSGGGRARPGGGRAAPRAVGPGQRPRLLRPRRPAPTYHSRPCHHRQAPGLRAGRPPPRAASSAPPHGLHRARGKTTRAVERSHVPVNDRQRPMRGLQSVPSGQRRLEGIEARQAVRRGDVRASRVALLGLHLRLRWRAPPVSSPNQQASAGWPANCAAPSSHPTRLAALPGGLDQAPTAHADVTLAQVPHLPTPTGRTLSNEKASVETG